MPMAMVRILVNVKGLLDQRKFFSKMIPYVHLLLLSWA